MYGRMEEWKEGRKVGKRREREIYKEGGKALPAVVWREGSKRWKMRRRGRYRVR